MDGVSEHIYAVVYRTGGREWCSWKRVFGRFTVDGANAMKSDLEKAGYFSLIHIAQALDVVGLPIGWDASTPIDYDRDLVKWNNLETLHVVGGKR